MKRTLMIGGLIIALAGAARSAGNGYNCLSVNNTSTNQATQNRIEYNVGGTNGFSSPYSASNLRIYDSATSSSNTMIAVDTSTDNTFTATMAFVPGITKQNAENTLKFKYFDPNGVAPTNWGSTFPSNEIINAQVFILGSGVYTNCNVSKLIRDAASSKYEGSIKLPKINTNGPNPYATVTLTFTRKESSTPVITGFELGPERTNASVTLEGVLPGEDVSLRTTTNLEAIALGGSWNALPITNYIPVTAETFGTNTSTTFVIPVSEGATFVQGFVK